MKDEDFDRLLKVSRLKLTEEERKRIKGDIEEIIGYFGKIDEIHTDAKPAYQPIDIPTRFREDEVKPFADVEELKKPSKLHKGFIIGPKL